MASGNIGSADSTRSYEPVVLHWAMETGVVETGSPCGAIQPLDRSAPNWEVCIGSIDRVRDTRSGGRGVVKSHIVLQLRRDARRCDAPHWTDAAASRAVAPEAIEPAIDRLLAAWSLPVFVTHEYRPAGPTWSHDEIASGLDRVYRLVLQKEGRIPGGFLEDVRLLPSVEAARLGEIAQSPLPPERASSIALVTDLASREAIFLNEAHRTTRGDPSVIVAVVDTGVAPHPELSEALLPGYDFVDIVDGHDDFVGDYLGPDAEPDDEVGHGTHVAGIIASRGDAMPEGVAPRCRILPVRALGAMRQGDRRVGAGLVDNINNAIKYAVDHDAVVINASLGVRREGAGLPHAEVVDYAQRKGVTIVAAAGNDGQDALYYPGALPAVIAVGAVDGDGVVAPFSTYGDQISLVAPGDNIYSCYRDGGYAFASGTSQASPFVTGAVALLQSRARSETGRLLLDRQVKHLLKHSADRIGMQLKDRRSGFGRLNVADALRLLEYRLAGAAGAREGRPAA